MNLKEYIHNIPLEDTFDKELEYGLKKLLNFQYKTCRYFKLLHEKYFFYCIPPDFDFNNKESIKRVENWKCISFKDRPLKEMDNLNLFSTFSKHLIHHSCFISEIMDEEKFSQEVQEILISSFEENYPFDYCFRELSLNLRDWSYKIIQAINYGGPTGINSFLVSK